MKNLIVVLFLLSSLTATGQEVFDLIAGGTVGASFSQSTSEERVFFTVTDPDIIIFPGNFPTTLPQQSRVDQVERTNSAVTFAPYVGRITSPNVTVGLGLDLAFSRSKSVRNNTESVNSGNRYGGYIWIRYTFNPENAVRFYVEPQLGYNAENGLGSTFITAGSVFLRSGKSRYGELGAPIGVTYTLGERILANLRVGSFSAVSGKWTSEREDESTSFTNAGFRMNARTVSIGFEILL